MQNNNSFKNQNIAIASNHIDLSLQELDNCATKLFSTLTQLEKNCNDTQYHSTLQEAIAILQMQDIITQRLKKIQDFLTTVDKSVTIDSDERFLQEFAWENEVDQADVDAMFENFKG